MIVNPVRYAKSGTKTTNATIQSLSDDAEVFYMQNGVMVEEIVSLGGSKTFTADRGSMIVIYNTSSDYSKAGANVTRLRRYGGMTLYLVDA